MQSHTLNSNPRHSNRTTTSRRRRTGTRSPVRDWYLAAGSREVP
ncbi:hypothetical protein ACFQH6_07585 [Halobacteriaceae archaeon GCM10025711]